MTNSKRKRGGGELKSACGEGAKCPTLTQHGNSLADTLKEAHKQRVKTAQMQSQTNSVHIGGRKKKGGTKIIVPQPPAQSGVKAGGSNPGDNYKDSASHTLHQKEQSKFDKAGASLDTSPPKSPFKGGKKRRSKRRRRKRKTKRKTRKKKRKTKRKKRKKSGKRRS